MSKKHTIKKTAAILLGLALTVGATGCDFIVTDNEKDLAQKVADVDITSILKDDTDFSAYEGAVKTIIENADGLSTVYKRDLVASFLNVGYTYVNSYGMSYKETFNYLMDGLVNSKILTQYAIAYYAKKADQLDEKTFEAYRTEQRQDEKTAEIDDKHPEILRLKYYLTDFGKTDEESMKDYNVAVYSLKKSLNNSLDSVEKGIIKAETSDHSHSETRTTPSKVNAEKEDYYAVDYDIYTGRNAITVCGAYEKVDGSTPSTRKKAYNSFLSNLQAYGLIGKDENTSDITGLEYYYQELSSSLAQALVNKYYEELNDVAVNGLTAAKVEEKYNELYADQKTLFTKDESAFSTAINGISDEKFVLYGQKGFGFVYNILLPFSTRQTLDYTMAKNAFGDDTDGIYNARKAILQKIEAEDLRTAWFCTEEDSNYSYVAESGYWDNGEDKGDKAYLFFEKNNTTESDRYESLGQYLGQYPYNGKATENEDGDYDFEPNKLNIDEFLKEMKGYIEHATKATGATVSYSIEYSYGKDVMNTKYVNEDDGKTDWSKFVYATGQVNFTQTVKPADYFKADTEAYKAISAVNELMFAYSTDTGCLNTYMGYVVSPYKTDFVSEFEYAAQKVVLDAMAQGKPGTFAVAPSDYGWHIIYCSFYYDGENDGKIYGAFNADDMETEGTLSYMFYEALKASTANNYTNEMQEILLEEYKGAATRYTKNYQNLLDMDN